MLLSAVRSRSRPEGGTSSGLRVTRSPDPKAWGAFVDGHPDASVFHTPQMHRVFAGTERMQPQVWATMDGGGIRALFTPVAIPTLGGSLGRLTTRLVAFAGPLVRHVPQDLEALDLLLHAYQRGRSRRALFTEIRNGVDPGRLAPIVSGRGFRHEPHLNFLVDLTLSEEELRRGVAASALRNVSKARRLGVTVEEAADPGQLAAGYGVLREVYDRIRVPLPHRSLFDAAHRVLAPLGRFKMLLASVDSRVIGVLTLLRFRDVLTYWYTGTLRADASYRAGDLLVWHAIQAGRAQGCRVLDFGGAGRPDEPYGVRDFKAKYGGRLVDHGRDLWVPAPLRLRAATAGYEVVRGWLS